MNFKLRQNTNRYRFTPSNRLPNRKAWEFMTNAIRTERLEQVSAATRGAIGIIRWLFARAFHDENRIALRAACFLTGRARGTSQRFAVARTRIKELASEGFLFGVIKASW